MFCTILIFCLLSLVYCVDIITTVAGNGLLAYSGDGGQATAAALNCPEVVRLDSTGNMYISDTYNHCLRKITVSTGIITTIAGTGSSGYSGDGGMATAATLNVPTGIAVDTSGNSSSIAVERSSLLIALISTGNVYIGDYYNNRIRKITVSTGIVTTFAGTGTKSYNGDGGAASSAALCYPRGVALDSSGTIGKYYISLMLVTNCYIVIRQRVHRRFM